MSEPLDCGDNSCMYAPKKGGMRTNGGCRCELTLNVNRAIEMTVEMHQLRRALARHGLVITRRAEAPSEPVAVTEARDIVARCLDEIDCDVYDDPATRWLVAQGRAWLQRYPAPGAELPHGIPEGENDKGWPEGTPESVTKGERNV